MLCFLPSYKTLEKLANRWKVSIAKPHACDSCHLCTSAVHAYRQAGIHCADALTHTHRPSHSHWRTRTCTHLQTLAHSHAHPLTHTHIHTHTHILLKITLAQATDMCTCTHTRTSCRCVHTRMYTHKHALTHTNTHSLSLSLYPKSQQGCIPVRNSKMLSFSKVISPSLLLVPNIGQISVDFC